MSGTRAVELVERARDSRFAREVVGPKIARPLAVWLQATFAETDPDLAPIGPSHTAEVHTAEVHTAEVHTADLVTAEHALAVSPAAELVTSSAINGATINDAEEPPVGFVAVIKALLARIKTDNLVVVAAGIAFWGLLAIPALLFSTVSIAGLVVDPDMVTEQVEANLSGLPEQARVIIAEQLRSVSAGNTGGLITGLVLGIGLALWSSSGATAKLMATMNTIYGTAEHRSFFRLRGLALLLTFGGIVFFAGAGFLLAALPPLLGQFDAVGDTLETVLRWLRFPALGLVAVIALGVLYRLGPDRHSGRYRVLTMGAVVATVLWVTLTRLFTIYTSTLASYNETYGSIGGFVVLMLWLFITAFVVLLGAEIDALSERETAGPTERASGGNRSGK